MNHYSETASDIANPKIPRIRHVPPEISHAYLAGDIDHTTNISIPDVLRQAAAAMGRVKSKKKAAAVRENGKLGGRPKGPGKPHSEETKERMRAAQSARRAQEEATKHSAPRQPSAGSSLVPEYIPAATE